MIDPTQGMGPTKPRVRRTIAMAALCALAVLAKGGGVAVAAPVEFGVDRSNMGTQWTLAWPQEPKVSPFLTADYNKPGNFEAKPLAYAVEKRLLIH